MLTVLIGVLIWARSEYIYLSTILLYFLWISKLFNLILMQENSFKILELVKILLLNQKISIECDL